MCIIVVKPETRTIPLPVLEHCWDTNPHGGGFALPDGAGGVTIHKALDWEEFVTGFYTWATVSHQDPHCPTRTRGWSLGCKPRNPTRFDVPFGDH